MRFISIIKKYFRILALFSKTTFIDNTASRGTFFVAVITKMLRMSFLIIFFQAIFLQLPTFAGWEFKEVLVLIAVYLTGELTAVITFHRNLGYYFPKSLRDGSFDFILTKPIHPLFHSAFRAIDWYDITSLPPLIVLWVYIFCQYDWSLHFPQIVLFIVFILLGLIFYFSLLLSVASSAFWTINATGVGRFLENVMRSARYPTTTFERSLRIVFLFILPISFLGTLPAEIFLGRAEAGYMIFAFIFVGTFFFASLSWWKYALRHYSSASS